MGKHRRQRQKLHLTASPEKPPKNDTQPTDDFQPSLLHFTPSEDLFKNINFQECLKPKLNDDTRSMKSFKSIKSEIAGDKQISKKEKLKLRKEFLLKKIDTVKQLKKEAKLREKRKKTAILGDTNALHDALPSLDSLLKSRPAIKVPKVAKKRGCEKAAKRKKSHIEGVQLFKQIMSNGKFKQDPFSTISEHVKAIVEQEKCKIKS